ncbi:hypothetical protein CLI64_11050 [Nostoc sp. CENA543]|uniref:hypothetical protein n=1 Tax=Nostoc sp. CENA543 TaxID=1869241 RepID=UPI000CA1000A|nr:hypothetical protein [Nostoc sp. CENA543]AUT00891.1 hypothetical protein CLI64_11050 [Nostoc sp. CENA543]
MARKVVEQTPVQEVKAQPAPKTFDVQYDDVLGTVSFELSDGTPIVMKKPKTRQLLLMQSWLETVSPEYRSNGFVALKLASLCTVKFGDADHATFDQLADVDFEDCERVVKALECFRDVFEHLQRKAGGVGAGSSSYDSNTDATAIHG